MGKPGKFLSIQVIKFDRNTQQKVEILDKNCAKNTKVAICLLPKELF